MTYTITIPKIVIPSITISWPLWMWLVVGYAVANFVLWQFVVSCYGADMRYHGENHLIITRLDPLAWFFAWLFLIMYLLG